MRKRLFIPLVALIALTVPVCALAAGDDRPAFDDSTVIVVTKPKDTAFMLYSASSVVDAYGREFGELGISGVKKVIDMPQDGISLFSVAPKAEVLELTLEETGEENVLETVEKLNTLDNVDFAQPNYYYYLDSVKTNDPYYPDSQYSLTTVGAEQVWELEIDCSNVTVAVLDSGLNMNHEDIQENLWVNEAEKNGIMGVDDDGNGYVDDVNGWDFFSNDNDPTADYKHGTHVAGIVGADTNNGKGIASLARNVKVMPVKVFGLQTTDDGNTFVAGCTSSRLAESVDYINKMGVKVANCSWGGGSNDRLYKKLIQYSDIVFTAAAGNTATNNSEEPVFPASYNLKNVISVASTNKGDTFSSFSNYSPTDVDIGAPGAAIYSLGITTNSNYYRDSGTSMSTPLVSSAAAVVRAMYPNLTAAQTVQYILTGADEIDGLEKKIVNGRRLNAYKALHLPDPTPAPPTQEPTAEPTQEPTSQPTVEPTIEPTAEPTIAATGEPEPSQTAEPVTEPTSKPTIEPTTEPLPVITTEPTSNPTPAATEKPTAKPAATVTPKPTVRPTATPHRTPEPTPVPKAETAVLVRDGNMLKLAIDFNSDSETRHDASLIKAYAVYKENGILKHIDIVELSNDYRAEFAVNTDYSDADIQVYVWGDNLQPICDILIPSSSSEIYPPES